MVPNADHSSWTILPTPRHRGLVVIDARGRVVRYTCLTNCREIIGDDTFPTRSLLKLAPENEVERYRVHGRLKAD
jgi:hypothetical protein